MTWNSFSLHPEKQTKIYWLKIPVYMFVVSIDTWFVKIVKKEHNKLSVGFLNYRAGNRKCESVSVSICFIKMYGVKAEPKLKNYVN